MTSNHSAPGGNMAWLLDGPYRLAAAGLLCSALAVGLRFVAGGAVFPRVLLLAAGVILAGAAVRWRLRGREDVHEERVKSSVLTAGAALCVLGAYFALDREWDSMRLFFMTLWWVAAAAAGVVLLPRTGRRIVATALILFHFGGITTAVTSVPTRSNPSPWWPQTIWSGVYRPYLYFAYLNNAYHFYSPEPGPPSMLWFRIEYEGGKIDWYKIANRENYPTRLQYQRLLAMTETAVHAQNVSFARLYVRTQLLNSVLGVIKSNPAVPRERKIRVPMEYEYNLAERYREPAPLTKLYIASYVRHVAGTRRHPDHPDLAVKRIKLYRVTHWIISPREMAQGFSPIDPTYYRAWYLGEFTPDGQLVPYTPGRLEWDNLQENLRSRLGRQGFSIQARRTALGDYYIQWIEQQADGTSLRKTEALPDPFLYWHLPIWRSPLTQKPDPLNPEDWEIVNNLILHAEERFKGPPEK